MWGLGGASLLLMGDDPVVRMHVFFWQRDFFLLEAKKPLKKPVKKARKGSKKFNWSMILQLLKTFKVRQFRLELDTDDYVINAYLYPLFYLVSRPQRQLSVNFEGRTNLALQIENRLSRMAGVFLFQSNFLTKKR